MLDSFDRYIARLIALPLLATLVIAAMLLLLDKMLRLFDFVVSEGGPVSVVWQMLANTLPQYLGLGIPVGLLLGILLAFRKLATTSELDAMRAVGVSYRRMLRVPYLYALSLGLLTLLIVGFVQPLTRYAYEGLEFELRSGALGASIEVGTFVKVAEDTTLRVQESRDQGSDLRGIFLQTTRDDGRVAAASATRGMFLSTDDPDVILLRLHDGAIVHDEPGFSEPRVLDFDQYDLSIALPKIDIFRKRGSGADDQEFTLPELYRASRGGSAISEAERRAIEANLHRRLVQIVVVLVIPLLALSLAVPPKRSSSALGVFAAIIILVVYNEISEYAERAGADGSLPIVASQWGSFTGFAVLCGWFYYVLAHVPAGQPIGLLDTAAAKISKPVRKLIHVLRARFRASAAS